MTGWFFWTFGISASFAMLSWLLLARITMVNIERRIIASGGQRPCPWDGVGSRIVFYAYGIILPEQRAKRLGRIFDVSLIRNHATYRDKILSVFFIACWVFFIGLLIADGIFQF
jgi:hypothetical protein